MTTFRTHTGSVLAKTLSAALVITAIFATPIQAHEYRAIDRHTEQSVGPGVFRNEHGPWMTMPASGALASRPQAGGVCDAGDDPMIC
jgi:hypothetical protein